MPDQDDKPAETAPERPAHGRVTPAAQAAAAEREARLAAALRANLHRRKAQARARREDGEPE
ncbi:hypothetical protein IAI18_10625 [Acetobacteraceae bacterium H6797]|nr:hypothetical protein [Acetobacteraceae bacterium H6797]